MIQTILLSIFAADVIYKYIWTDTSVPMNINSLFNDMTTFIETQRLREDKIREECNNNDNISDKSDISYNPLPTVITVNLIHTYEYLRIYIMEPQIIHTTSFEEFIEESYKDKNINKQVALEDTIYTLLTSGKKINEMNCGYGNHQFCHEIKPTWSLQVGSMLLYITDINNQTES